MKRALLFVLVLLAGCNFSRVKQGDPLHAYVGSWYYLATPLSGPGYRNANVFGKGRQALIDAGTRVRVTWVERAPKSVGVDWNALALEARALEPVESMTVYRVHFDGPEVCKPRGCEAHWRLEDDAAFDERFERIFVEDDPLAGLPAVSLALIKAHKVAGWMSAREVRLSFGEPNVVVSSFGRDHWVFEERRCGADLELIAVPKVELVFEGSKLVGHVSLSPFDHYVSLEPTGPAGVCYDPRRDARPAVAPLGPGAAPPVRMPAPPCSGDPTAAKLVGGRPVS